MSAFEDVVEAWGFKIAGDKPAVLSPAGIAPDGSIVYSDAESFRDLIGAEPELGNPSVNGWILSSSSAGVRSWVAPNAHSHAIADVTGLQAALDARSLTSHNHDAAYLGISATAAAATKLATARTLTIGSTGKTFDGSANVSWSLAEIGAQPAGSYAAASHTHDDRYFTETEVTSLLSAKEPGLGNPGTSGWLLSSTTAGIRSWVAPYALPTASASVLGGVKVGAGLAIASGVLSVSYGTAAGTACQGNDSRLSDARTPLSHVHAIADVTGLQTALDARSLTSHNHTLDSLSNTTITSIATGELLRWSGTAWVNATLSEAGIQPAGSYLTGNQTITLSGIVTGSGATAITTSIADAALSIAKTSGLQAALDAKMATASYPDLVAIEALAGTSGLLRKTAANTWSLDTASYALSSAIPAASSTTPSALGTASVGIGTTWARADHVHAMPTAAQVGAAAASHSHAIADVTGLQTALDARSLTSHNHTLDSLSNTTITSIATGELLRWNGTAWVNNTLSEAGIQPAGAYITAPGVKELYNWYSYSSRPTDCNLAPDGFGGIRSLKATSTMTANKPPQGDSHIIHLGWDNTVGFDSQLAVLAKTGAIQSRGCDGGVWTAWRTIWDSGNLTNLNQLTNGPGFVSLSSVLTGYAVGSNSSLAASDTLLGALGKVQAQINARPGTVTSVGLTAPANMAVSSSPVTGAGTLALAWNGSSSNLVRADGSTISSNAFRFNGAAYVLNGNQGSGYVKFASITIPGGSLAAWTHRWSLDGREEIGYLGRRSILTFAVRRNSDNSFDARFYLTDTGSDLTEEVTVRTNDGITWDFYIDGTSGGRCAFYWITPEINGMGAVTNTFVASASMPSYSTVIVASRYGYAHRLLNARTFTIGSTGKPFNGTADLSWSLAEIGAASSSHNHTVASLTDVAVSSIASGELLKWNGSQWINNTLSEAGIQANLGYTPINKAGDTAVGSLASASGKQLIWTRDVTPTTSVNSNYSAAPLVVQRASTSGTTTAAGIGFYNQGANAAFLYYDPADSIFKYHRHVAGPLVTLWDSWSLPVGSLGKSLLNTSDSAAARSLIAVDDPSILNTGFALEDVAYAEPFAARSYYNGRGGVRTMYGIGPFSSSNNWYNVVDCRHRNKWSTNDVYGGELAWGMTSYTDRLAFRSRRGDGTPTAWTEVQTKGTTADFDSGWTNNSTRNNIKFKVGAMHWCNNQSGSIVGEAWRGTATYTDSAPYIELTSTTGYLGYGVMTGANGVPESPYLSWDADGITFGKPFSGTFTGELRPGFQYVSGTDTYTLPSSDIVGTIRIINGSVAVGDNPKIRAPSGSYLRYVLGDGSYYNATSTVSVWRRHIMVQRIATDVWWIIGIFA